MFSFFLAKRKTSKNNNENLSHYKEYIIIKKNTNLIKKGKNKSEQY
jgi:hypothetical protein